jgi:hypothetical protein
VLLCVAVRSKRDFANTLLSTLGAYAVSAAAASA